MPGPTGPIGGAHFLDRQLLNMLRAEVADPGIDDPNAIDKTGHGRVRDAGATYAGTGDGHTTDFTVIPPAPNADAPVVCITNVTVGGAPKLYGLDYLITWGEKFGPNTAPGARAAIVSFFTAPGAGAAVVIPFKYGLRIVSTDGKLIALGSFINVGFSRGAMPLPKVQCTMEEDTPEPVGIGDNWDSRTNNGAMWHNITWRITVMSLYADECKDVTDSIATAVMRLQHTNNYFMPIFTVVSIKNLDFDIDQKMFIRLVLVKCRSRQIF